MDTVTGNSGVMSGPRRMTYDRVLLANGWSGEYHGKYHSPYNYSRDEAAESYYSRPVQCDTDRLFSKALFATGSHRGFSRSRKACGPQG